MAREGCGQVNIPAVDNDNEACEFINSSSCVLVDRVSPKLNNIVGETLSSYFEKLDNKIISLEYEILVLKQRVSDLEG